MYAPRLAGEPHRRCSWRIIDPILQDPYDYWQGLARLWDRSATIVNVEHDHPLEDRLVRGLVECEHPLCTHAYRMHLPEEKFAHARSLVGDTPPVESIVKFTARGIEWIREGEEWADFSGIGFCKILAGTRKRDLERIPWQGLELSVNAAVLSRWHVHWPETEHHHTT